MTKLKRANRTWNKGGKRPPSMPIVNENDCVKAGRISELPFTNRGLSETCNRTSCAFQSAFIHLSSRL